MGANKASGVGGAVLGKAITSTLSEQKSYKGVSSTEPLKELVQTFTYDQEKTLKKYSLDTQKSAEFLYYKVKKLLKER
jgi:hypothetical protein